MNTAETAVLRVRYRAKTAAGHAQPNAAALLRLLDAVDRQAFIIARLRAVAPRKLLPFVDEAVRRV